MQINSSYQVVVKPEDKELPIEGPASLIISIYNTSKDTAIIFGNEDDFSVPIFQIPYNWVYKEKSKIQELKGILPKFSLLPGQTATQTIYLHDFFSEIKPGDIELPITISFWEERNSVQKLITHTDTCYFKMLEYQASKFDDRINKIHKEILSDKVAEKRLKLYQSLANLEHPEIVTILLEALLDNNMLVFQQTARKRLIYLTEKYGRREDLVEHLGKYGSRYDSYFFQLWKEGGIVLSDIEIARLAQSASPWIQVFCLENYPGPYNRNGVIESLKADIQELRERVQKLN